MKKLLALTLAIALSASLLTGCSQKPAEPAPEPTAEKNTEETSLEEVLEMSEKVPSEKPYIAIVSKGKQHQFWQTVMAGAEAAAKDLDASITFDGPQSETDIDEQVDMLNTALTENASAICLAALDTNAVTEELALAKKAGIPVIGFGSGVPDAPEGSIVATASTDNYAAGALAAESLFESAIIKEKIASATKDSPVTIAVQSQDAANKVIVDRTQGFLDKMVALVQGVNSGGAQITGHDKYQKMGTSATAVTLAVTIPPSSSEADGQAAAQAALQNSANLIAYYCSSEAAADGLLAATADGTELDRGNGTYKDLVVVGFDAGSNQKNAVKNQYFYGAVTQDPYQIGYMAVDLAYKALQGEKMDEVVDTGSKFYTHTNMDREDIAHLLYD